MRVHEWFGVPFIFELYLHQPKKPLQLFPKVMRRDFLLDENPTIYRSGR